MQHPLIIGHRGASAVKPENTIPAFECALHSGADGVEFDVRLARDGVPVIIHDPDLKRTAGRSDLVSELSAEQLAEVDVGTWFNLRHTASAAPENASATLPTLRTVFELLRQSRTLLYVELKCSPAEIAPLVSAVVNLIDEFSIRDQVIVECFDLEAILHVKQVDSSIKTAALFEPHLSLDVLSTKRIVSLALASKANQVALHHSLITASRVRRALSEGLETIVWTVDKPRWVQRALDLGIVALITNDPAKLVETRGSMNRNSPP
jgi:glycerophosphoryl diester phosphodiesterase